MFYIFEFGFSILLTVFAVHTVQKTLVDHKQYAEAYFFEQKLHRCGALLVAKINITESAIWMRQEKIEDESKIDWARNRWLEFLDRWLIEMRSIEKVSCEVLMSSGVIQLHQQNSSSFKSSHSNYVYRLALSGE